MRQFRAIQEILVANACLNTKVAAEHNSGRHFAIVFSLTAVSLTEVTKLDGITPVITS